MIGKNELLVKSIKDHDLEKEVGLRIEKDAIHIMKKDFVTNIYTDAYIEKGKVMIDDSPFECELAQLAPKGELTEEGNVHSKETGKTYNFEDADVVAEIDISKVEIIDDIESEKALVVGEIVDSVYKGDHYQLIVRTENEEDFVLETTYTYDLFDKVGIFVDKKNIRLRLKKDLADYEI